MADYNRATDPRVLNRSVGSAAGAPKRLYTGSSDAAHEQYPDHQTHYRARSRSRSPSRVHATRHHSQHDYSPHDSHRHSGRNRSRSPDYRHSRHYERHGAPPRELYQISHPRFRGNPQPSMLAPDIPRLGVKNSDHPSIIRDFFCRHPSLYDCEVIVFALRPDDNSMALAENVVSKFTSRNLSTALIHGYIRNEWITMMNREMHSLGVQFFYLTWAHSAHTNVVTLSERSHDDYRKKPPSWGMYDTVIKGCSSEEAIEYVMRYARPARSRASTSARESRTEEENRYGREPSYDQNPAVSYHPDHSPNRDHSSNADRHQSTGVSQHSSSTEDRTQQAQSDSTQWANSASPISTSRPTEVSTKTVAEPAETETEPPTTTAVIAETAAPPATAVAAATPAVGLVPPLFAPVMPFTFDPLLWQQFTQMYQHQMYQHQMYQQQMYQQQMQQQQQPQQSQITTQAPQQQQQQQPAFMQASQPLQPAIQSSHPFLTIN